MVEIRGEQIRDGTIDTVDIVDGAITQAKLDSSLSYWNNLGNYISPGNTANIYITNTGFLGIGTSPTGQLDIDSGSTAAYFNLKSSGTNNGAYVQIDASSANWGGIARKVGGVDSWFIGGRGNTQDSISFYTTSNNTERMRLHSTGQLSIGNTVSTVGDLSVGSGSTTSTIAIYSGTANTGVLRFADGSSGNSVYRGYISYDHSVDRMYLGASAVSILSLDTTGVGVGGGHAPSSLLDLKADVNTFIEFDRTDNASVNDIIKLGVNLSNDLVLSKAGKTWQTIFTGSDIVIGGSNVVNSLTITESLGSDAVIALAVKTSTPTGTSGYGKIFIGSDNKVHFINSSGTEYTLNMTSV